MIRIPIPNKVAWFGNIILAGLLGIAGFFLALTAHNITRAETVLLVIAGLMCFYFLRIMIVNKWNPWGWHNLPEIIWNVVGTFVMFEIIKAVLSLKPL
jgi:hypothetical protein